MENEIKTKISTIFEGLVTELARLYEYREATTIANYVFEDAFAIFSPAQHEQFFTPLQAQQFSNIKKELLEGRPWQYVLGEADFYGLKFLVDERVLIPRAETEELVDFIVQKYKNQRVDILDVGTGSGCIAVSLDANLDGAKVSAVDVSQGALELAQRNAQKNKTETRFDVLDILDVKATKKMPLYHVIISNPPYIQDEEAHLMPKHVLDFEPHLALFITNNDPLQFYKAIADFALEHLHQKGCLFFEINEFFGKEVLQMLSQKGFSNAQLQQDMFGRDRIVWAELA